MGCTSSSSRGGRHQRLGSDKGQYAGLQQFLQLADSANGPAQVGEQMSVLAVFPRNDQLIASFEEASRRLAASFDTAHSVEKALELYIEQQHDLLLIDRRPTAEFDADSLAKSLRSITHSSLSTFVAVTESGELDGDSLNHLLQLGYDKRFKATASADACYEELLSVQRTSFRYQQRIAGIASLLTALDNCSDAVEITDDRFRVQYVNSAHEALLGYSSSELIGKTAFEAMKSERDDQEVKNVSKCLRRGKEWTGSARCRRKSGATCEHHDHYLPVRGKRGRVHQFVCIKRNVLSAKEQQQLNSHRGVGKDAASAASLPRRYTRASVSASRKPSVVSITSAPLLHGPLGSRGASRNDSGAVRVNSITMEAPIHRVISLINAAQDGCSASASATLDKVLDILHQSNDLYSGELMNSAEDRMTSDYVGGLMSGGSRPTDKRRYTTSLQSRRGNTPRPSLVLVERISRLLENSTPNMLSFTEIPEQIVRFLDGEDEWSFDILELERVTDKKPMVYLAMKTLRRFNVCQFLQCGEDTMMKWLQVMQDHYHADNQYHNATHGADVMQSSAYFLERDRIKSVFDDMDEVASLLAALVHDLDHPGRTNPFLINSQHRLALLYNDISVLESHHVSLAFQLTVRDDRINIFKNMSRDDCKTLRQSMIDIVLATEMAKHFEHVGKFSNQIVAPLLAKEDEEGAERITEEEALEMLTKPENRVLIKRVLIKCSDVSNPCRSLKLCKQWAARISEEYFQQTDEEKSQGLPIVMPVFDRTTCNMPHSQTSFIDFFLREMFTAWHAFCDVPELVENLNNNYAYWKQLADENKRSEEAAAAAASAAEADS